MIAKILYIEGANVKISDIGMQVKEFKNFYNFDKSKSHVYFHEAMTFIYYCYAHRREWDPGSPYLTLPMDQRLKEISTHLSGKYEVERFIGNSHIDNCIKAFNRYSKTPTERDMEDLYKDMHDHIERIKTIPSIIKKKENVTTEVNVGTKEEPRMQERVIQVNIHYDNSNQKLSAYEKISKILDMEERYKKRLLEEEVEGMFDEARHLFEIEGNF